MSLSSANVMNNGALLAARPGNTGSGTRTTRKQAGPRTDETCRERLALLAPFSTGMITSDNRGSYAREVSKDMHLTGKIFTQRIERNNLTRRTHIKRLTRKTLCFSHAIELHEKVIGAFIEKYMFHSLESLPMKA